MRKKKALTAPDRLKQLLVFAASGARHETAEDIDRAYRDDAILYELDEARDELRGGTEDTGLDAPSSRHYETKAVAAQMLDGGWVGWTYWYGGGKHGDPGSVDWVADAYEVEYSEETRVVKVFRKREGR